MIRIVEVTTFSNIPNFVPFGVLYYTQDTGDLYIGTGNSSGPAVTFVSGPVTGGTWGTITGTLSSQTDLQTALNARAALSISQFNPHADGVTDDTTAFTAAQAALTEIWLDAGKSYFINSNLTLTSDFRFLAGSKIILGFGKTLTVNGQILAPEDRQILSLPAPVSDNCTRANENPMSDGGNWSQGFFAGSNAGQLASNLFEPTATSTLGYVLWTGNGAFPADQYSEVVVHSAANSNSNCYAMVRGSLIAGTFYTAYVANLGGSATVQLYKYINGTGTQLGSTVTMSISAGARLRLVVKGSNLYVFVNGGLVIGVNDTAIASGYPGMATYSTTSISNAQISSWSARAIGAITLSQSECWSEWFGAVADGVTDDSLALQAAIDAVSSYGLGWTASNYSASNTLRLRSKTYAIATSLYILSSGVAIRGAGQLASQILFTGTNILDTLDICGSNTASVATMVVRTYLQDFSLARSQAPGTGQVGLRLSNCVACFITNVDSWDSQYCVWHATSAQQVWYTNCQVGQKNFTAQYGFYLAATSTYNSTRLRECLVNSCVQYGFYLTGSSGVADLFMEGCETALTPVGLYITSAGHGAGWMNGDVHFVRCIFDGCTNNAAQLSNVYGQGAHVDFDSCHFNNTSTTLPTVDIENSVVSIRGSNIKAGASSANSAGAVLLNGANAVGCVLANNNITCSGLGTLAYGVKVNSALDCVLMGNLIYGQTSTVGVTTGIALVSAARTVVMGNSLNGFMTTGITLDAGCSNCGGANSIDTTNIGTAITDSGTSDTVTAL